MIEFAFNLKDPDFVRNPYPLLTEWRETTPFFYDPQWGQVYATRYEDIAFLLKDKRLGRSITHVLSRDELGWPPPDPALAAFNTFNTQHMLDNEPPKHTRMKALVQKAFTPQRVDGLRGRIQNVVNTLLDVCEDKREFDLHDDFAEPLPVIVIAELLGVPEPDRHHLRPWSEAIVKMYELGASDAQKAAANLAAQEFSGYIRELAHVRKTNPGTDLISAMVQTDEGGDSLTEDELTANVILLLNAGHEATVNGITAGLLALQRHPTQKKLLIDEAAQHPSSQTSPLFRTAIEELLRYDTPLPMFERWVLEDFDHNGFSFQRGSEIGLIYASGNRDPRKFVHADALDVTRTDNAHLTFGLGVHYCIGAPLARLEMQLAFHTLLRRFPNIEVLTDAPQYSGFVIRGIQHLPVKI